MLPVLPSVPVYPPKAAFVAVPAWSAVKRLEKSEGRSDNEISVSFSSSRTPCVAIEFCKPAVSSRTVRLPVVVTVMVFSAAVLVIEA
ncbi:hypothetical protein D9M69_634460 [compost metagenome]